MSGLEIYRIHHFNAYINRLTGILLGQTSHCGRRSLTAALEPIAHLVGRPMENVENGSVDGYSAAS